MRRKPLALLLSVLIAGALSAAEPRPAVAQALPASTIFEAEALSHDMYDRCFPGDCYTGYAECMAEPDDYEICAALMEGCKRRCGATMSVASASESPAVCHVPVRLLEGGDLTWISPAAVSEYHPAEPRGVRVFVGWGRHRELAIDFDRWQQLLADGCQVRTQEDAVRAAVLSLVDDPIAAQAMEAALLAPPHTDVRPQGLIGDFALGSLKTAARRWGDPERLRTVALGALDEVVATGAVDLTPAEREEIAELVGRAVHFGLRRIGWHGPARQ